MNLPSSSQKNAANDLAGQSCPVTWKVILIFYSAWISHVAVVSALVLLARSWVGNNTSLIKSPSVGFAVNVGVVLVQVLYGAWRFHQLLRSGVAGFRLLVVRR